MRTKVAVCGFQTATLAAVLVLWHTVLNLLVSAETVGEQINSEQSAACVQSLFSDRYRIPSTAFTATSEQVDTTGSRRYAADALRTENTDSAWCPRNRVGPELNEFVQVDMGELNVVTKLVISGLLVQGGGSRFAPHFFIKYKRESTESEWRTYRQLRPVQTPQLLGSSSALVPKFVVLDPPVVARWIRIYPYHDLVEYQIPEGSIAVPPYHAPPSSNVLLKPPKDRTKDNHTRYYQAGGGSAFSDTSYDGYRIEPGSLLDGGLGCLTDLGIAPQNVAPTPMATSVSIPSSVRGGSSEESNRWFVGWHRDRWRMSKTEGREDVVDMLFRFTTIRSFKRLKLYASNNYREKVRLPRRIELRFSIRGVLFSGQPVIAQDFLPDNRTNGVMSIELDLNDRIGRVVQLKAFFADEWMLFSEIKFQSHLATDPILFDESTGTRRSRKEPTSSGNTGSGVTALPTDLVDFSARHLPTVIILALLIVAFLVVIGFTCLRMMWKRKQWHAVKQTHGGRRVNTRMLPEGTTDPCVERSNGRLPTTAPFFISNGTTPKIPNELSVDTNPVDSPSEADPFSHTPADHDLRKAPGFFTALSISLCSRSKSKPSQRVVRLTPTIIPGQPRSDRDTVNVSTLPAAALYPYATHQPSLTNDQMIQNGQSGLTFNCNGHFGQIVPPNLLNEIHPVDQSYSQGLEGQSQPTAAQLATDWFLRSGYSNSATNSTGASVVVGAINPEMNLYTTVNGESDADSNGPSTVGPEYASANPKWAATLAHTQPKLLRPTEPSFITTMRHLSSGLSPRFASPTSITVSGAQTTPQLGSSYNHHTHPNNLPNQPLIYYNPNVSTGHVAITDARPVQFYEPYSQPMTSIPGIYIPPQFAHLLRPTTMGQHTNTISPGVTSLETPTISLRCQDTSVVHSVVDSQENCGRSDGLYCTPNETRLTSHRTQKPQHQPQMLADPGPWIKANCFDVGDARCPPVPSTPPPPPPSRPTPSSKLSLDG
ncbi:discoidin domain-containing receptor 2 [Clonorchis sinensis]|uniref:Discoidin domain-containing receptor 2 n=1 Tax=Clonorchis sinensis TaxID=79923 RepID=H2KPZ4_CLOSI|nr:discoidin domain-containing receptor 2 [Clonorchis sinensis]